MSPTRNLGTDFRTRFLTAVIVGPLVLLLVYLGGPLFQFGVVVMGLLTAFELQHMVRPGSQGGLFLTIVLLVAAIEGLALALPLVIVVAVLVVLLIGLIETWSVKGLQRTFFVRNYGYLVIGGLYIGLSLGLLVLLRDRPADGLLLTVMLLLNNWGTDSFALIGGRLFGKRKLAPHISPGKTVEGALTGLTVGVTTGTVVGLLGGLPLALALSANVVIALAVEAGDLLESWTKRRLDVKDSGSLLPGHGGVLDRIDGTLLAVPALWLVLLLAQLLAA